MNKAIFTSSLLAILLTAGFAGAASVQAKSDNNNRNPVEICHSRQPQPSKGQGSGPQNNPYGPKTITVDGNAISKKGHDTHNGPVFNGTNQDYWGDIIPPFKYGNDKQYPGMNWTAEGQAIYNNGCQFKANSKTADSTTVSLASTSKGASTPILLGEGGEPITLPQTGNSGATTAALASLVATATATISYAAQFIKNKNQ